MGALLGKGSFGAVFNAKWTQHSGQQMSGRTSVCGVWCVMRACVRACVCDFRSFLPSVCAPVSSFFAVPGLLCSEVAAKTFQRAAVPLADQASLLVEAQLMGQLRYAYACVCACVCHRRNESRPAPRRFFTPPVLHLSVCTASLLRSPPQHLPALHGPFGPQPPQPRAGVCCVCGRERPAHRRHGAHVCRGSQEVCCSCDVIIFTRSSLHHAPQVPGHAQALQQVQERSKERSKERLKERSKERRGAHTHSHTRTHTLTHALCVCIWFTPLGFSGTMLKLMMASSQPGER